MRPSRFLEWCDMTPSRPKSNALRFAAGRRWLPCSAAALVIAAAWCASPAHAALWKWVDSNGRTVYSDIPPTGDVKAERVNGPAPPANPNAVKDMASQEADLKKRQLQRVEDQAKADKAKVDTAKRQEQCTIMRGQLKSLQMNNIQHYRVNEKGERVFLDDAMKRQQAERTEQYLKEHCDK